MVLADDLFERLRTIFAGEDLIVHRWVTLATLDQFAWEKLCDREWAPSTLTPFQRYVNIAIEVCFFVRMKAAIFGFFLGIVGSAVAQTLMFVSEYASGNLRGYDFSGPTGVSVSLPSSYTPVGGSSAGADGMATGPDGRLYVNRGNGTIWQRSTDGLFFANFATMPGAGPSFNLLDLTATPTHLYGARFGFITIYQTNLTTAVVTTISGPVAGATQFDGVRIGPDGRLYAVDSSDGDIFAYNLSTSTWSPFLVSPLAGDASQIEFGNDGRVFISRTVSGQARIYSYTLNISGDYSSGLNPLSQTLIGTFGNGTATGIRIGPDNRLYANNFGLGEVWRSNIGITAMEASAYVTGLSEPGSIFFAPIPEPSTVSLALASVALFMHLCRTKLPSRRQVGRA
jgi:hypothetical protein